ncbi:MAG: glucose-6-phosphate isomerase family protein [Brevinema sp.]
MSNPGFNISWDNISLTFSYGEGVFGPIEEQRSLESIRQSLLDPKCSGPEIVYSIAMDVGCHKDRQILIDKNLLYGSVIYNQGRLGDEPIRSQGHVHAVSQSCGMSTPELYEIWQGKAIIYMQENVTDDPGRCFAVIANPGDKVLVPPSWGHMTISADSEVPLVFGAWCVRDFGFDYKGVREHNGLAWFPVWKDDSIVWRRNPSYRESVLVEKSPRTYSEFSLDPTISIYKEFERNGDIVDFIARPSLKQDLWNNFIP